MIKFAQLKGFVTVATALGLSTHAFGQDIPSPHVPPEPPKHELADMTYREMTEMMQMDDTSRFGTVILDQAEWRKANDESELVWNAAASFGGDINKLVLKTEGERAENHTEDASADLLWDHVISRWWNLQSGARQDFGRGPSRTWAALGVEGLSPFWAEVDATLYVGEQSRTAARIKAERDLLITQRWVLQPELEANLYGKSDPERQIGSGLSDIDVGLRLRYEIQREIAPYVGISWRKAFGETADLVRFDGGDESNLQLIAGIRMWF